MASSLAELYERGAHQEVWEELVAIGDGILDPAVRAQAERVADLTMRRAATNVALLTVRLTAMGYRFGARHLHNARRRSIEDLGLRDSMASAGRDVAWIDAGDVDEHVMGWTPPGPEVEGALATLERRHGPLPLSLVALMRHVGAVDLSGGLPSWGPVAFAFDDDPADELDDGTPDGGPVDDGSAGIVTGVGLGLGAATASAEIGRPTEALHLLGAEGMVDLTAPVDADGTVGQPHDRGGEGGHDAVAVPIGADHRLAANQPGDFLHVVLPDPVADPVVAGVPGHPGIRLVEHLRRSFAWGGFPGFEHAERVPPEIDALRNGLLSI